MDIKLSAFLFIGACKHSMSDEVDVPPLEDLSSVLQRVLHSKDVRAYNASSSGQPVINDSDNCATDVSILLSVSKIHHLSMLSYESFVNYITGT